MSLKEQWFSDGADQEQAPRILTRQEFLATYQFSQGHLDLQHHIFRYLRALQPPRLGWTGDEDLERLHTSSLGPIGSIALDGSRHGDAMKYHNAQRGTTAKRIQAEVHKQLQELRKVLRAEPCEREELIPDIARLILEQDWVFTGREDGRGYAPSPTAHFNPYRDRWRSDLCYFGF